MTSPVRHDLPFLKRRIRPTVTPPTPPAPPVARPASPAMSHPVVRSAPSRPAPATGVAPPAAPPRPPLRTPSRSTRSRLFPAPAVSGRAELDAESPVARLDLLRSSIGTLLVEGATEVVWESTDLVSGTAAVSGETTGTVVMTAGNRPLVGFHGDLAAVTLRHVRELRRALFVGGSGRSMGIRLADGSVVTASSDGAGPTVVLLLVIDGVIELRVASASKGDSSSAVHAEFGFEVAERFDFLSRDT